MTHAWLCAAVAVAAAGVAALWPLSAAVAQPDSLQARLYASIVTAVACATIALSKRASSWFWTAVAVATALAGVTTLLLHFNATSSCVTDYAGRPIIIGRTLAPHAEDYVRQNPGASASDLLLDAGGVPDRVWTRTSIRSCRFWLGWGGLSALPLFAACVCASIARRRYRFEVGRARVVARAPQTSIGARYDAFLSYRHADPDKAHACEILEMLEAEGLRVAIDFRDFRPNEHFLSEMERCIKESRFMLCVITSNYLDSGHCTEEALISKTFDMADRRRRLVPLIFDRIDLPVWLHGAVGIDCTQTASIDPLQRLLTLFRESGERSPG